MKQKNDFTRKCGDFWQVHDILYIVQYSLRLLFECYAYFVDVLIYTQRGKGFHDLRTNVLMYPDFLDT